MLDALYSIVIFPLYQIVEVCYVAGYKLFHDAGSAVLCVSFAVSLLCLPLYVIAEKWQEAERVTQKKLAAGIARIKRTFKGDEQYMILSTFYRQHHYHPIYALRSSISLAIQIPFFIAAYQFLSRLDALRGVSFLFIRDMGSPDALFSIGAFSVNVLPIAMTLINVISGAIYSRGHSIKEKAQIYITALVFLIILYNSPSGLVLYWTCNNIFSLIKNIFYKFKRPLIAFYVCLSVLALALSCYVLFMHTGFLRRRLMVVTAACLVFFSPLITRGLAALVKGPLAFLRDDKKLCKRVFLLSGISLALLCGAVLPALVISSSPMEFSFVTPYSSPFFFLRHVFFQALGFCVFWPCCIYFLFGKKIKTLMAMGGSVLAVGAILNAFAFVGNYGTLSTILTFSDAGLLRPTALTAIFNALALLVPLAAVFILIKFNKTRALAVFLSAAIFALTGLVVYESTRISRDYESAKELDGGEEEERLEPIFHFSRDKKNVFVIMLDRAISGFIPYIFEEDETLYEAFDGFTFYPDTSSFATHTITGSPPLYGGYAYTPLEMNRRKDEPLVEKHNEALLTMPLLFSNAGFKTTLSDLSWANYSWIPDMRLFDAYPNIETHPTMRAYTGIWLKNHPDAAAPNARSELLKRNFIWYSFLKVMPLFFRDTIYNDGFWWSADESAGDMQTLIDNYAVLDYLPELSDFDATGENGTFTLLVNELTHDSTILKLPDYTPDAQAKRVEGMGRFSDNADYHVNIAAIKRLGEFFRYLQKNGAYDNTRVIIVADHGGGSTRLVSPNQAEANLPFRIEDMNPLLMVKDFDAHGKLTINNNFMTNADVPPLALEGIVENPRHPITGREINQDGKKGKIFVTSNSGHLPNAHNANTFRIADDEWYSVHDDIFDPANWKHEAPEL